MKELKKSFDQAMVHRIKETVDEIDFNISLWKDILDGTAEASTEEAVKTAKSSYIRRKLNARLGELIEIKDNFITSSNRIEKEIVTLEKDLKELDEAIADEDNERKINELYKRITATKSKLDALIVRKSNYYSCYNLLDMIYAHAAEIVEASEFAREEIGKAKAFLNIGNLRRVLTEPEKALWVLKRMQVDIKEIYNRTMVLDDKITESSTGSAIVSDNALAYKEAQMRKKREKEILLDDTIENAEKMCNNPTETKEDN